MEPNQPVRVNDTLESLAAEWNRAVPTGGAWAAAWITSNCTDKPEWMPERVAAHHRNNGYVISDDLVARTTAFIEIEMPRAKRASEYKRQMGRADTMESLVNEWAAIGVNDASRWFAGLVAGNPDNKWCTVEKNAARVSRDTTVKHHADLIVRTNAFIEAEKQRAAGQPEKLPYEPPTLTELSPKELNPPVSARRWSISVHSSTPLISPR